MQSAKAERRPGKGAAQDDAHGDGISYRIPVAMLLRLSVERDLWTRRLLGAESSAYQLGYRAGHADGRAQACVAIAEIEERYRATAWWRDWSARLRRIIASDIDPSIRMGQVMAEIAADQKFMAEARRRQASNPRSLSPLELCALRRIRLTDPGDDVSGEAA